MKKSKDLVKTLIMALVFAVAIAGWGCNGDNGKEDVDVDTEVDVPIDDGIETPPPDGDVDVTPDQDVPPDIEPEDVPEEDVPPDLPCPANCAIVPEGGEIGAPCVSAATCDHAASCSAESVEFFNSEMYVSNYQGMCLLYGAGAEGCDPDIPTTCPPGSQCEYMGEAMGQEYYGCWDSCDPIDTSGNPYEYNCGCREGYACDLTSGMCYSGCSNDRYCCERWWDLNDDFNRQPGEVVEREGCTNYCDSGGLFDETTPPPGLCNVSFQCINNGDPTNFHGGPCEGDAWCPPDGRCLDEFRYAEDPADPPFPGGYCIKDGCNFVGRGCTDHGGACANLGSTDDPFYTCVGTCHFGRDITDTDYECRTTEGQEQACVPVDASFWFSPPSDGSDGWCWPGEFPGGTGEMGTVCEADEDCVSPYGLGICLEFSITMTPFCGLSCSQAAAEDFGLCGEGYDDPDNPGTTIVDGACWSGICWEACPDPTAALADNGCSSSDNACYPVSLFGTYVYIDSGAELPAGFCIPACTNDAWCADMWGMPMTCDPTTGVCG